MCAAHEEVLRNCQWPKGKVNPIGLEFLNCKTQVSAQTLDKGEETSLKKTRRIEITAFRRQVTICSDDYDTVDAHASSPSCVGLSLNTGTADRQTIDSGAGCDARLNAARANVDLLVKALRESERNRGRFSSRLGSLGHLIRSLKTNFNALSQRKRTNEKSLERKRRTT